MNKKKVVVVFMLTFTILLSSFAFYAFQILKSPNILVDKEDRYVLIPEGTTFKEVQDLLYKQDVVQDMVSFSFLAKLMEYDVSIKPGRYLLKKNMTNVAAIRLLRAGTQSTVNITFNSIRLRAEIGEKITKNIALSASEFDQALEVFARNNPYGFDEHTVISMFIPNTYEVYYTVNMEGLLDKMYQEYQNFWTEERQQKAANLGLSPIEVSTLASIVETEQRVHADERARIAGVYINRLKRGIKLDSDPTLVFAHGDFSIKRVLNTHKEIDSPSTLR